MTRGGALATVLILAICGRGWADPVRHRPEDVPLRPAERDGATYWSLRFGPADDDVLLGAFLSSRRGEPAEELVWLLPGHPRLGTLQRVRAERRRRGDDGPALFRDPLTLPLPRAGWTLEVVELEKRPGQGRLLTTARLHMGQGPQAPSLLLQHALRQTSGERTVIALQYLDLDSEPLLSLRSIQRGRFLYAALLFGGWDIVFPDRRPGIPALAVNPFGGVIETATLRPTDEPMEQIFNWVAEFRRLRPGESYTLRVEVEPGPNLPPLAEELPVLIPVLP